MSLNRFARIRVFKEKHVKYSTKHVKYSEKRQWTVQIFAFSFIKLNTAYLCVESDAGYKKLHFTKKNFEGPRVYRNGALPWYI